MVKENETEKAKKVKKEEPKEEKLNPELVEDVDRIGNILCRERLKKGLELEDISQVLCIRRAYLEAIENGNYVELPPLPYSAGFVSSYAKYLGLNNVRIAQLFREELNEKPEERRVFMEEDMAAEASLPDKRYIIGSIVALLLIGGLWSCFYGADEEPAADVRTEETAVDTTAGEVEYFSPVAEENGEVLPPATENQATGEKAENVLTDDDANTPNTVVISEESFVEPLPAAAENAETVADDEKTPSVEIKISKEDTWIEVRDADKIYFNKVMHPGESYQVPEKEGMILSAGKYDGVEVYINGKLTPVIQPNKKMRIPLDPFIESAEH